MTRCSAVVREHMNLNIRNKTTWILEAFNKSKGTFWLYACIRCYMAPWFEVLDVCSCPQRLLDNSNGFVMTSLHGLLSLTNFEALLKVIVAPSTSRGPTCLCDFAMPRKVSTPGLYRSFAKVFILSESLPSLRPYIHQKTIFSTQSVTYSKATFFNHHQTLVRRYRD